MHERLPWRHRAHRCHYRQSDFPFRGNHGMIGTHSARQCVLTQERSPHGYMPVYEDRSQKLPTSSRLVGGKLELVLLDVLLDRVQELGLLKQRGKQRTDSTHVLAAVRTMNRLERVGETLRAALNILAVEAPEWLTSIADPEWVTRSGRRIE